MVVMAPSRNTGGKGDGKPKKPIRKGEPLHVWINPALSRALDDYLEATAPKVSKTAAVEEALRQFLAAAGRWPPKPAPDQAKPKD